MVPPKLDARPHVNGRNTPRSIPLLSVPLSRAQFIAGPVITAGRPGDAYWVPLWFRCTVQVATLGSIHLRSRHQVHRFPRLSEAFVWSLLVPVIVRSLDCLSLSIFGRSALVKYPDRPSAADPLQLYSHLLDRLPDCPPTGYPGSRTTIGGYHGPRPTCCQRSLVLRTTVGRYHGLPSQPVDGDHTWLHKPVAGDHTTKQC